MKLRSKVVDSLFFQNDALRESFVARYDEFAKTSVKKGAAPDPVFAKEFVLAVRELGALCLYPVDFPVSSYFEPNLDVYTIIGLALLAEAFDTLDGKLEFIDYAISLGYLNPNFSSLLKSALHKDQKDWHKAFLCAKQSNDSFSHCGAAYRTLHSAWEECEKRGIHTGVSYPVDDSIIGKFCSLPFRVLFIGFNGKDLVALPCHCPIWLAYGKHINLDNLKTDALENVWRSPELEEIRTSILNGSYKYCSKVRCPLYKTLPDSKTVLGLKDGCYDCGEGPESVVLAIDNICNLKCRTCRSEKRKPGRIHSDESFEVILAALSRLMTPKLKWFTASANGEVLASPYSLRLLENLPFERAPNLKIALMTNAELLATRWHKLNAAAEKVRKLVISFHAITAETYILQRPNGSHKRFMEGIEFASNLKHDGKVEQLNANVTIHADNMAEAQAIYKTCQILGFDQCTMSKLENWGTFTAAEYKRLSIWNSSDSLHRAWKGICGRLREMSAGSSTKLEFTNMID